MKTKASLLLVAASLSAAWVLADNFGSFNIDFVGIGSAGYAADGNGYGGVGYDYRIGKTEVTIDQFLQSGLGNGNENQWVGLGSNAPAVKLTWHEAARYCNWLTSGNQMIGAYSIDMAGLVTAVTPHSGAAMDALVSSYDQVYVLPTEDEWYKAAYFTGSGYSLYANGTGSAPVNNVDSLYNAVQPWLADAGSAEQNGTYNMMGNVWEYLETAYGGALNLGDSGQFMAFRGGEYDNGYGVDYTSADFRENGFRYQELSNVGFRIVAIPEPGTISLMGASSIGIYLTRRLRRRKLAGLSLFPIRMGGAGSPLDFYASESVSEIDGDYESLVQILAKAVAEGFRQAWISVRRVCKRMDNRFWDGMIVVHNSRVSAQKALKRKVVDGFDAFLAMILK